MLSFSHSAAVHLIVPRAEDLLDEALRGEGERAPTLELFAGRGSVTAAPASERRTQRSDHRAMLHALGLSERAAQLPSAAVCVTGFTGEPQADYWMHLEPVHFAAGLSDVSAMRLRGAAALTAEERAALTPALESHLRPIGAELVVAPSSDWFVRMPGTLQAATVEPASAFAQSMHESLPSGPDAPTLRRLMTEMQMLLHDHGVNASRQRRGAPAVNAIWIWGAGSIDFAVFDRASVHLPEAYGADDFLRGIYRLHGQSLAGSAEAPYEALARRETPAPRLAVAEATTAARLESTWLVPMRRALATGALHSAFVWLDRWCIAVTARDLRRFWRRPSPVARWAA